MRSTGSLSSRVFSRRGSISCRWETTQGPAEEVGTLRTACFHGSCSSHGSWLAEVVQSSTVSLGPTLASVVSPAVPDAHLETTTWPCCIFHTTCGGPVTDCTIQVKPPATGLLCCKGRACHFHSAKVLICGRSQGLVLAWSKKLAIWFQLLEKLLKMLGWNTDAISTPRSGQSNAEWFALHLVLS